MAGWSKAMGCWGSADEWITHPISAEDIALNEYQVTYVTLSHGNMDKSIHDFVASTLAEMGLPAPANFIQTMLGGGHFVGWKFRYDDGHAIWWAGDDTMEFFDGQGTLLKTVVLDAGRGAAA
jgi:hypothetical protein